MSEKKEDGQSNALVVISNEFTSTPISLTRFPSSTISDIDDTPRIICNELIVNPNKSNSIEKLDELFSLEREIAKMHHADESILDDALLSSTSSHIESKADPLRITATSNSNTESDLPIVKNSSNIQQRLDSKLEEKLNAITSGETPLEHEDLIAVLKGLDGNTDESLNSRTGDLILEEGVTIEGEGEYQIMEVIDEDSNATEDAATKPDVNSIDKNLSMAKTYGSTTLTAQEERALALEQIAGLKSANKQQRRRKQDIKPNPALDLVSALEAEWSENDDEILNEKPKGETKTKLSITTTKASSKTTCDNKANSPLITSVVVIPSQVTVTSATATTTSTTTTTTLMQNTNVSATCGSSSTNNDINAPHSSPIKGVMENKTEEDTQVLSSQTGFRRTRIIKRKIIWDPDAPETNFSYANLVKSNNNTKPKTEAIPTTTITKGSTTITPIKKDTAVITTTKKTQRPTTPKDKKSVIGVVLPDSTLKKDSADKETLKSSSRTEELVTKAITSSDTKASLLASPTIKSSSNSPTKRRSQTPVSNGPGGAKKKKITELDRLMGDEGAVNMLNSLEKIEANLGTSETKSTRPMMRSRAATICEKLPRKETTPPARTTTPTVNNQQNNKGRRTPKSRASSSWDYVYKKKKQDFDDSLIIRRRSNSSYSSTTSLNRLSLDGPPASIANTNSTTKSNDSKSSPASTTETDSLKISSSHSKSSGSLKIRATSPRPGKSFEFAKPENKKSQKRSKSPTATLTNDMKKAAPVASRRNGRSPTTTNDDKEDKKTSTKSPAASTSLKDKKDTAPSSGTISDVVVKKSSKVAQILFSTNKAKLSNTFTIQMLNKLVDILDKLASDPDCHVIVIGTNETHFCQGIDITDLTTITAEKRKHYALNLATSVKNYLKTLATYPKPLIAGVYGNLINLGVIQLALFDVVIAGDKTTFETPYAKIGQVPEGYCIWNNMNKIRGSFKTKLFWLCEKVQSTEAALAGLVNKLTTANKVNDEALITAKRIASLSTESYRVMKKTIINSHLDVIARSLDEEFDAIIKQWTSNDCLENMKKIIENGHI